MVTHGALPDSLVLRTTDGRLLVRSAAVLESLRLAGGLARGLAAIAGLCPPGSPIASTTPWPARAAAGSPRPRPPVPPWARRRSGSVVTSALAPWSPASCAVAAGPPASAARARRLASGDRPRSGVLGTLDASRTTIVASSSQGRPSPQANAASKSRSRMACAGRSCSSRTIARTRSTPKNSPALSRRSRMPSVSISSTSPGWTFAKPRRKCASGSGPITVPPMRQLHLAGLPGLRAPGRRGWAAGGPR